MKRDLTVTARDRINAEDSSEIELLQPISAPALPDRPIKQRQRLGRVLNYYYRDAA